MKKLLFTMVCAMMLFMTAQANTASLFSYDEAAIANTFEEVSEFEEFVETNDMTFAELTNTKEFNSVSSILAANGSYKPMFGFDDIQWGSFAWGFCCWPIGIFTVLLNDNKDSDDRISYFIGAGVAVVLWNVGFWGSGGWRWSTF